MYKIIASNSVIQTSGINELNISNTHHHIIIIGTSGTTNTLAIILNILNCHINNNKNGVIAIVAHKLGIKYFFMKNVIVLDIFDCHKFNSDESLLK